MSLTYKMAVANMGERSAFMQSLSGFTKSIAGSLEEMVKTYSEDVAQSVNSFAKAQDDHAYAVELEKELEHTNTCYQNAAKFSEEYSDKASRYKQALDEIEEVFKKDQDGDYDFIKWRILNIINEVKDIY